MKMQMWHFSLQTQQQQQQQQHLNGCNFATVVGVAVIVITAVHELREYLFIKNKTISWDLIGDASRVQLHAFVHLLHVFDKTFRMT